MKKIEIKHRFTGKVLFEYESDDNTIKKTLLKAIKSGSDFRGSDLRGSDLRGSDLRGSDLSYSDLSGSNLSYSDLSYSDLSGSNLSYSYLRGSDLRGSNLSGSNLSGSNLSGSDLSGSDLDYTSFRLRCGFGFAKTDAKQRKQLIAHIASFFKNSELNKEEEELFEKMKEYCSGWHRENEFGKL